ncbi:MAG: GDSL-type esterase/lipase family protein [Solirubrobacterales bacterium]
MKIICIGDSLTTGFGVFKEQRWTNILMENYKLDIVNKGVNGDTTTGIMLRFYQDVIALNPTHASIMAGCNDFLSHRTLENVVSNVEEIIMDAENSSIIPILCTEIPIIKDMAIRKWSFDCDYDYAIENISNYRNWILKYTTENNILCIDFYKLFMETMYSKSARELYIDGLHPTKVGHKLMAQEFAQVFSKFS